ncbi:aromatic amino acid transaminase [Oceanospirillum linum]|uniref:Aminotransferase n=1 Tax=Oceanospirillum linum TaxID=966 RepID=A0A1T1HFW8_OCELI|nr:amino acid aminotransferase [Oceanospirillum linum]OOV88617.1 aromatic amino acid aminotransferase [Oceanospirillum linum]SEG05384.1 L-aspartate aminotransferase apoenzyme [Oleiphilus messinensis]SMP20835.1 L-aspartate aminotransferase apoenzyme [Oceanospirillum linum]
MFENVKAIPGDALLALMMEFKKDPTPAKIDLGVGVYKDDAGLTPILPAVKKAEALILENEQSKGYIGPAGAPELAPLLQSLMLGDQHNLIREKRIATTQTPGGTGALRVAGDLINALNPNAKIWVSDPTWSNHFHVFAGAGIEVRTYPYYDAQQNALAFENMLAAIHEIPSGDVILLHASCHNPTGIDPTLEQWQQISDLVAERALLPLIDCAYQGFGDGLEEDVQGLKLILEKSPEALITTSCSKNFGLYNERIGALSVVAAEPEHCNNVFSQACNCIRANYSNPPAHGAAIVTTILSDQALRQQWETELSEMRTRIHRMRTELVKNLSALSDERDFSFIAAQKGMFSYSGLSRDEVKYLKDKYAIYAVDSGRINIAGINDGNLGRLSQAIAEAIDR